MKSSLLYSFESRSFFFSFLEIPKITNYIRDVLVIPKVYVGRWNAHPPLGGELIYRRGGGTRVVPTLHVKIRSAYTLVVYTGFIAINSMAF